MKKIMSAYGFAKLCLAAVLLFAGTSLAQAGTLFVATDNEDFAGGLPCLNDAGEPGVDRLAVVTTDGPLVTNVEVICTTFLINGMADADGKLLAGTPRANPLNTVGFDGSLISSIAAPGIPDGGCCNEEMLFVPQPVGADRFFHAHWSDVIREIDPVSGAQIGPAFPQTQIVGMALINEEIWTTKWSPRQVGIWDPDTNTFNHQVQFDGKVNGNYGALAWDPVEEVLWLGTTGGFITPFDLAGVQLGPAEQPLGAFGDTIDGMTFLGEVTPLVIDAPIDIKFCSNPNGFNCKSGGVMPMTVFGTDDLDVAEIDLATVQLCLADDDTVCIGADSLRDANYVDRGHPDDVGVAQCAINEDTGEEEYFLNPDDLDDLELAWDKRDVVDILFDGCEGFDKGEASPTLVFKAQTNDGTDVASTPVDDPGIDQVWRQQ